MKSPLAQRGIYELSPKLFIGTYPDESRTAIFKEIGITHVINVDRGSDTKLAKELSFATVKFIPIVDGRRIPFDEALPAVDEIHRSICEPHARVYVHCYVCCNRSPTVAWFYLVALGMDPVAASDFISARAPQVPSGHAEYYGPSMISQWQEYGRLHFQHVPCDELARIVRGEGGES